MYPEIRRENVARASYGQGRARQGRAGRTRPTFECTDLEATAWPFEGSRIGGTHQLVATAGQGSAAGVVVVTNRRIASSALKAHASPHDTRTTPRRPKSPQSNDPDALVVT